MGYINVIKYAFLFFPVLCLLLSLPFLFYHYRKYGSITFLRFLLVFSFFFYLLCAYFLVILPLPNKSDVLSYNGAYYNLKPFFVVPEIFMSGKFNPIDFNSYVFLLNQSYLEPLFNILMTIPFGIYLRYYFKCGFFKTLVFSFLLSLFFELTQLTGLYFWYPRPYRLCDVNDLINNTTGGILGFFIAPLLALFLPKRDSIDDISYERGRYVSVLRKGISLVVDYFIIIFVCIIGSLLFHIDNMDYIFIILSLFIFVFISYFSSGYTFGRWLLNHRSISNYIDGRIPIYKYFIKWIVLHLFILNGWFVLRIICEFLSVDYVFGLILYFVSLGLFLLYCLFCLILNRDIFINRFLNISSESFIGVDDEKF